MKSSRRKQMPTQERLRELLDYHPVSGILTRKPRPIDDFPNESEFKTWNTRFAGQAAGVAGKSRYLFASVDGTPYCCQCLVWVWNYGDIPDGLEIDHIDGNGHNNALKNLTLKTHCANLRNQKMRSTNTSGVTGVIYYPSKKKPWMAKIRIDGKHKNLGMFSTKEEAAQRYADVARTMGYTERHITGK